MNMVVVMTIIIISLTGLRITWKIYPELVSEFSERFNREGKTSAACGQHYYMASVQERMKREKEINGWADHSSAFIPYGSHSYLILPPPHLSTATEDCTLKPGATAHLSLSSFINYFATVTRRAINLKVSPVAITYIYSSVMYYFNSSMMLIVIVI